MMPGVSVAVERRRQERSGHFSHRWSVRIELLSSLLLLLERTILHCQAEPFYDKPLTRLAHSRKAIPFKDAVGALHLANLANDLLHVIRGNAGDGRHAAASAPPWGRSNRRKSALSYQPLVYKSVPVTDFAMPLEPQTQDSTNALVNVSIYSGRLRIGERVGVGPSDNPAGSRIRKGEQGRGPARTDTVARCSRSDRSVTLGYSVSHANRERERAPCTQVSPHRRKP